MVSDILLQTSDFKTSATTVVEVCYLAQAHQGLTIYQVSFKFFASSGLRSGLLSIERFLWSRFLCTLTLSPSLYQSHACTHTYTLSDALSCFPSLITMSVLGIAPELEEWVKVALIKTIADERYLLGSWKCPSQSLSLFFKFTQSVLSISLQ